MVNVGIFKTRPTAIMRQLNISLTVLLFFITIASGSFLDFVFHSSRHPSEQNGLSEVPASDTDPSQRIWNMVPVNECLEFSHGTEIRTPEHKTAPQAVCVAALSRSPQHWSSYSGYLRDVPQLCFAFRRWHDIDTAHLIQRNTSIEALNLLVLLRGREEAESKRLQQMKITIEDMEMMKQDLQHSVERMREAPREALVEASDMIAQLFEQHSEMLEEVQDALVLRLQQSHELVIRELRRAVILTVEKVHSEAIATAFETAKYHSQKSHLLLQNQYELASSALDALDAKWQGFALRMLALHESTEAILASASRASSELDTQFQKLTQHQVSIDKTSRSLDTLSTSLEQLVALAEDRLISINNTAWEVQNSLSTSVTPGWFLRVAEDVLWSAYLQLKHLGVKRLAASVDIAYYMLPACWYILRPASIFWGIATAFARAAAVGVHLHNAPVNPSSTPSAVLLDDEDTRKAPIQE
ncbi:hypothetical protein FRC04_004725 [Tulasnella sp. 424]|nr:hypothetical protein FRC04_004725 [Tulasnella sp. 424]